MLQTLLITFFVAIAIAAVHWLLILLNKKIHHGAWFLALLAGGSVLVLIIAGAHWRSLLVLGASAAVYSGFFRVTLNILRNLPQDYMGPSHRTPGDSKYDTFFWWLGKAIGANPGELAMQFESLVLLSCVIGHTLTAL